MLLDAIDPIDHIILGGFTSPGVCKLTGLGLTFNWELRQAHGMSGAEKVLKGRELAKFTVAFKLYTAQDLRDWATFVGNIRYPDASKTTTVKGLDVGHPLAALYGVKSATIVSIGALERTDTGTWESSIECEEYRAPVATIRKANGSQASKKPKGADAGDPETEALTAENQRLVAQDKAAAG